MLLNSNDLFEQIGLVAESNNNYSFEQTTNYEVFLQIQLSQGKHELLAIKNFDDPHQISLVFCRKHKLNSLAVEIVESKIREAKLKEENRTKRYSSNKRGQQRSSMEMETPEVNKTRIAVRQKQAESKSISRSKSRYQKKSKSPTKAHQKYSQGSDNLNGKEQAKVHRNKKANPNIGNELYCRGMVRYKMQETQRVKKKEQQEKDEQKELTFQPKINPISAKIMEFRKENPNKDKDRSKQNKRALLNISRETAEQAMKQCTFKPQINRVYIPPLVRSNLIAENSQSYKDEFDHFNALYKQAEVKQQKLNSQIEKSNVRLFQPTINPRSQMVVKETFDQRLQRSLIQKKKLQSSSQFGNGEYSFKPKVGRAPKDNRNQKTTLALWDHLSTEKLRKSNTITALAQQPQHAAVSEASNFYYEHLIEKRISEVFEALDGDEDQLISPEKISIDRLSRNELIFLKPLFQEMEELEAELDHNQFKKALINLLKDTDPSLKGAFLSQRHRAEQKSTFTPLINQKSKQIVLSRVPTANSIYDQLYEQGLKEIQKKEYRLQAERARQEEQEVEECSFKPHLNNTSKYYIDKVLGKKINQKFDDERLFF